MENVQVPIWILVAIGVTTLAFVGLSIFLAVRDDEVTPVVPLFEKDVKKTLNAIYLKEVNPVIVAAGNEALTNATIASGAAYDEYYAAVLPAVLKYINKTQCVAGKDSKAYKKSNDALITAFRLAPACKRIALLSPTAILILNTIVAN
jgi:hypothetical protein